jgi:hypothetical protein
VRALLGGPADWLTSPAVVTAFPGGTELGIDGVEIDGRVATVSLNAEFLGAGAVDRAYAQRQLTETLGQLGQVNRVQIRVEGNVLEIDDSLAPIATTPVPVRGPVVITPDGLALLSGNGFAALPGGHAVPAGLDDLAMPYGGGTIVGVVSGRELVALTDGGAAPVSLLSLGTEMLPPSYDVDGWVWTGPTGVGTNEGQLIVLEPRSGTVAQVAAPDLLEADVVALRVSREGARLAYAVSTAGTVQVYVAAVERDPTGRPVSISQGQPIGAPMSSLLDLAWVDDVELAVLGAENGGDITVMLLGVGGQTAALPSVAGATAIAAGDGRRELYLVTDEGDLYGRSGNGWRRIDGPAISPTFEG